MESAHRPTSIGADYEYASKHSKWARRAGARAIVGLVCLLGALATTATASARPPSHYQNWAQTPHNAAGVVFHP